jgi:DNA polymerase-3 subunit gamma/tau
VDVIVKSLERSRIGHAYLFSGPRGCGKTTVARLLAKALNCLSPSDGHEPCCECGNCLAVAAGESLDVIEIDGASNNSVDEVRELKSHVTLAPFSSPYKIYIVDEVHMLSIAAFNALLKTLEEPPACVVFVLATTEAHKVPVTIRSRCQHIPFHRIGARDIYDRLAHVCAAESIGYQAEALWEIARQADGALRDALSMLEQVANLGRAEISLADVETTLGQGSRPSIERWISGWRKGEAESFLELDRMLAGGASPQRFVEELFSLVRNLWLTARWKDTVMELGVSEQEREYLRSEAPLWTPADLESVMRFLAELLPQTRLGLRADVLSGLLMAKMFSLKEEPRSLKQEPPPKASPKRGPEKEAPGFALSAPPLPPLPPRLAGADARNAEAPKAAELAEIPSSVPPESEWTPLPEERWDAALETLREGAFALYCALLESRPFLAGEGRVVLSVARRYGYETLKLDRNRSLLKKCLESCFEGMEIALRHEKLWTVCDVSAEPEAVSGRGRRAAKANAASAPAEGGAEPGEGHPAGNAPEGVPFDGLVAEAARWLRGDVVLVRRGVEEEDADVPAEE